MAVHRHFVGWDEPVTDKIVAHVLRNAPEGPVDLAGDLLVVPTRQAGRRLREALALACARRGSALLSARIVLPAFFLRPEDGIAGRAEATTVRAVWADVLRQADLRSYPNLFPSPVEHPDFSWALRTGETIQDLRQTLVEAGLGLSDVPGRYENELAEPDRWRDLARLEDTVVRRLEALGLQDPCRMEIRRAEAPSLPAGVERVVVAAVPDPPLLVRRAWDRLAGERRFEVLVHAPPSWEDRFDGWGRPIPEAWQDVEIPVPDPESNIVLAASPAAQSRHVIEAIDGDSASHGPGDIAIGVPDRRAIPFLDDDLTAFGLPPFDPSDRSLAEHPLYRLAEAFLQLAVSRTYAALGVFLRNADVLHVLHSQEGLSPCRVLAELDEFQNLRLPVTWDDVDGRLKDGRRGDGGGAPPFGELARAAAFVRERLAAFDAGLPEDALRALLLTVHRDRALDSRNPRDAEFRQAAEKMDEALRERPGAVVTRFGGGKAEAAEMLLHRLAEQTYHGEREEAMVDLEGWLELPWNDAGFLIVTGMNEGIVPDSGLGDAFLPDSLRHRLGLRDDAARLARDAFLMRGLVESRGNRGRVLFIAGKTGEEGDPLRPSRLLFRCPEQDLPRRAALLFGAVTDDGRNAAARLSFRLDARPPDDAAAGRLRIETLSVTSFRDFLACPFRFYLKHVLDMQAMDDRKPGPDAMDFGTLLHEALERMGRDPRMRACGDERRLADYLEAAVEESIRERFAASPSFPVAVCLSAARERLRAAARVQAELVREGWEMISSERTLHMACGGLDVRGKIDRVDRHRKSGRFRILDYKSSDAATSPEAAHLAGVAESTPAFARVRVGDREKRWIDLQLPLYRRLLAGEIGPGHPAEVGYFHLPRAVTHTGVALWGTLDAPQLESAGECARRIAEKIARLEFWPPAERVEHEEFESVLLSDARAAIDEESFVRFLEERSG